MKLDMESKHTDVMATVGIDYNSSADNSTDMTTLPECVLLLVKIHHPMYMICTGFSLIACFIALIMYIIIRDQIFNIGPVRKDETKHWINMNFIISFILRDLLVSVLLILSFMNVMYDWPHIVMVISTYIIIVNFYWMLAEGLWLYLGVFFATKRKMLMYTKVKICIFGWLLPLFLVVLWSIWAIPTHVFGLYDKLPAYICIIGPIYSLLFINLIMMIRVLHRLSGMLHYQPKRRLAKATLGLTFLLGIQFLIPIIMLITVSRMSGGNGCLVAIVRLINDSLSALQGLFVATLYVLTNDEVKRYSKWYVNIPSRTSSPRGSLKHPQVEPTSPFLPVSRSNLQVQQSRETNLRNGNEMTPSTFSFKVELTPFNVQGAELTKEELPD